MMKLAMWSNVLCFGLLIIFNFHDGEKHIVNHVKIQTQQSIFEYDSCALPCWFGLIPGISTAEDVETLFLEYEEIFTWSKNYRSNVFDLLTGYVQWGHYDFYWREYVREDIVQTNQIIEIQNGTISRIQVSPPNYVSLKSALQLLGQPDEIRFENETVNYLHLIYHEANVRVVLASEFANECNIQNIEESFWVSRVSYYSLEAALEPVRRNEVRGLQPALFAYSRNERLVPPDTWQSWLAGEVEGACWEGYEMLSNRRVIPTVAPTVTPVSP